MPNRNLSADRAHGEASLYRAQAEELIHKANRLEHIAIEGWARAEFDRPLEFTAVFWADGRTHCVDTVEGLYAFIDRIRAKHPTIAELSISLKLS